jgi:hypothetical protein
MSRQNVQGTNAEVPVRALTTGEWVGDIFPRQSTGPRHTRAPTRLDQWKPNRCGIYDRLTYAQCSVLLELDHRPLGPVFFDGKEG